MKGLKRQKKEGFPNNNPFFSQYVFQHKHMILLKNRKSNINRIKFYKSLNAYNDSNKNIKIQCPKCYSDKLVCHGYYKRTIVYDDGMKFHTKRIKIKRVKCKSCNTTHALLPMDIIPYKPIILSIIIDCIYDQSYFNKTMFSFEVREKWIKQYKMILPYLKTMFLNNFYENIKKNINLFYERFYTITKKIPFLIRKCIFNIGFL